MKLIKEILQLFIIMYIITRQPIIQWNIDIKYLNELGLYLDTS